MNETPLIANDRVVEITSAHIRLTLDSGQCPQVTSFFDEATFMLTLVGAG